MKQAITLTAVAAAAVAAGATAPNTADAAVPVSHAQIGTVESSAQIASGKATPGDVHAAMQSLGMDLLHSPLNGVTANSKLNPSATPEKVSSLVCNGNWCIVVHPDLSSAKASSVAQAEAVAAKLAQEDNLTLSRILSELDQAKEKDADWKVRLDASGKAYIG